MYDTSHKFSTLREAKAEARVTMAGTTAEIIKKGRVPKGDVFNIARTAAVLAAKKTSELIPYCHPLPVDFVEITYEWEKSDLIIRSGVKSIWKTGVEMEALTAVSIAALTVYDMIKPLDDDIGIERIVLTEKSGGKSQFKDRFITSLRAAVLVISDSTFKGTRKDKSGIIIKEKLEEHPVELEEYTILPDDIEAISRALIRLADDAQVDMVFTTGGTGLGPRDVTCEATMSVLDRTAPGIAEAVRDYGQKRTPYAMLSRGVVGVRGKTLILNLPGSSRGAAESMEALFPGVLHAMKMIRGGGHPGQEKGNNKPSRKENT